MKIIHCDLCKKKFSKRDEYVGGELVIRETIYEGDDGSNRYDNQYDVCETCILTVGKFIHKMKEKNES